MYRFFKRFFDIALSLFLIILFGLPMILVAIAIKIDSKGPVVFKQERIGKNGKVFKILKFRSMCVNAESTGSGVYSGKGDKRVTRVGRIIRATSIDELMQLFNILKGDMSFIGPRPPLTYHPWPIEQYTERQKKMFQLRPGITGWAQVNGRKKVEWSKRIKLNVWYVENVSLWLDIKILFKTVLKVFINADNANEGATVIKGKSDVAEVEGDNLKLMYITNMPQVAQIAEHAGVERIFVDMEYIGKSDRQGGMDTVQSHHTYEDIKNIRSVLTKSKLLVRCNPIHEATDSYCSSKEEIDAIIECGADIIMLPYFKEKEEVEKFISYVGGRARTMLLFETPESVKNVDKIISVNGIDEVFIGLNDLSLGYGKKFMFELLSNGTVEKLCNKFAKNGLNYGFGGIAALGQGMLPAEKVIAEHYRLGSTCAILSRSFCNVKGEEDIEMAKQVFDAELKKIRDWEKMCSSGQVNFKENKRSVKRAVKTITKDYLK